jgi:hypothetical protein
LVRAEILHRWRNADNGMAQPSADWRPARLSFDDEHFRRREQRPALRGIRGWLEPQDAVTASA